MAIRLVLVNDSNSGVTDGELEAIADACEEQLLVDYPPAAPLKAEIMQRFDGLRVVCAHRVSSLTSDWNCYIEAGFSNHPRNTRYMTGIQTPGGGSLIITGIHSAAGFHSVQHGLPYAVADSTAPKPVSVTVSHELIELIGNGFLYEHVPTPGGIGPDGTVLQFEACDPVDCDAYRINGIAVSNFVTARWFGLPCMSRRFDRNCRLSKPFELFHGGHIPRLQVAKGA